MKSSEIRQISTGELTERLEAEVNNYEQMLLNHSVSPLNDYSKIKSTRSDIARIKTELCQRELNK